MRFITKSVFRDEYAYLYLSLIFFSFLLQPIKTEFNESIGDTCSLYCTNFLYFAELSIKVTNRTDNLSAWYYALYCSFVSVNKEMFPVFINPGNTTHFRNILYWLI